MSFRPALVALLAVVAVLTPSASPVQAAVPQAEPTSARATALWVWDSSQHDAVLALARRKQVTTLLVSVNANIGSRQEERTAVARLVMSAHRMGLRVEAVGGAPDWGKHVSWVLNNWLRPTLEAARFDAVQLDVEPYLDPSWRADRSTAVVDYLNLLRSVRRNSPLPVHAAVPFWFDQIPAGSGRSLTRRAAGLLPEVTIMAYRNTTQGPNGLLALAEGSLKEVAAAGGKALVGIETLPLDGDPDARSITFAHLDAHAVDSALTALRARFTDARVPTSAAFAGVAVHDAPSWIRLGG